MSLPSVSGRLSAPLRFALKSPVSSLASRQDEIANFVSRFHGILGGRASAREKRKRTRDSFFILWLSRVIPFPFLGARAQEKVRTSVSEKDSRFTFGRVLILCDSSRALEAQGKPGSLCHSLSATNLPKQRTTASVSFVEISCHETDCDSLTLVISFPSKIFANSFSNPKTRNLERP